MKRAGLLLACICSAGCSTYVGTAVGFDPESFQNEPGWIHVRDVPLVRQQKQEDCGAAALSMVLAFWAVPASPDEIAMGCTVIPDAGIRAGDLRDFARKKGFKAFLFNGVIADLRRELSLGRPVIVGMVKPCLSNAVTHFEVVVGLNLETECVVTLDPARGWRQNRFQGFRLEWEPVQCPTLVVFR
jgi:ABC-type bacteriocin/lantibiotic exporter with double-glycine peptidase domain